MKNSILWIFVALPMLFSSCQDFLDVQSDSKFSEDYVYSSKGELNYVLTSVYASLLSNDLYGEKYLNHYALNSDVEFTSFSGMMRNSGGNDFRCFDGEAHSKDAADTWKAAYQGVERANLLIYGVETSPIYDENDEELMQMLGEAKTLRAMLMHDLVVHFGDVPFPKVPTFHREEQVPPIEDRNATLTWLINDLKAIAPKMKYAHDLSEGIERASREFCFAMIARMALTRGGYSLRPDKSNPFAVGTMQREDDYKSYYAIARDYADSVIMSQTHALTKSFVQVFVDECNYIVTHNDDPIFEIPFAKHQSGSIGYRFGPRGEVNTNRVTTKENVWGESAGGQRINALYSYSFDTTDVRRDVSVGIWGYRYDGTPLNIINGNSLTHYANKWSKFWTEPGAAMGVESQSNTGINYPYMRYADVLLMYAEAVNEYEDGVAGTNGAKAKEALKTVRQRAFPQNLHAVKVDQYVNQVSVSKDTFFMAIVNERKWEFGGENLRWKDLVRWNLYSQVVYQTFMDIYTVGMYKMGEYLNGFEKWENLPNNFYYATAGVNNPQDINRYQNKTLNILQIQLTPPASMTNWREDARFDWGVEGGLYPRNECCYSFRGYIRGGDYANYTLFNKDNLPPVRYLLPMPRQVILMSKGGEGYTNYYGY